MKPFRGNHRPGADRHQQQHQHARDYSVVVDDYSDSRQFAGHEDRIAKYIERAARGQDLCQQEVQQ
jgi:hypothetical protein